MRPWFKKRHTFRAFNYKGELVSSTWTESPVTYHVEREAYQTRLNKGHFAEVQITSNDPWERAENLVAQKP